MTVSACYAFYAQPSSIFHDCAASADFTFKRVKCLAKARLDG